MSEEQKAINILKNMTTNYSLSGEQLHYANILYYLIINLQQENNQLKAQRQELRNWLEFRWEQSQDVLFVKIINKLNELEGKNE